MPLRRVMIDWGDKSYVNPVMGIYENRKPFCSDANQFECRIGANDWQMLTCENNDANGDAQCQVATGNTNARCQPRATPRFGTADRACEEGFFTFTHDYACTENELATNGKPVAQVKTTNADMYARLRAMGLADNELVCAFKPKVQALDNWGWCNATDGGFEDGSSDVRDDNACTEQRSFAWTSYAGEIIVVPRK